MAIVQLKSDLFALGPNLAKHAPANRNKAYRCASHFTLPALLAAADIASTFDICVLPANGRYLAADSKVKVTAGGAGALFSVGHAAYKGVNGETVPASATFFGTALNVAAAGSVLLDTLTTPVDEFDIPVDLVMTFTVAGANLPIGFAMSGTIGYLAAFVG